jgi:hypothetical protein
LPRSVPQLVTSDALATAIIHTAPRALRMLVSVTAS